MKLDLNLTVYIKINAKWTMDLKYKSIRLLGRKPGGNLQVPGLGGALSFDITNTVHKRENG